MKPLILTPACYQLRSVRCHSGESICSSCLYSLRGNHHSCFRDAAASHQSHKAAFNATALDHRPCTNTALPSQRLYCSLECDNTFIPTTKVLHDICCYYIYSSLSVVPSLACTALVHESSGNTIRVRVTVRNTEHLLRDQDYSEVFRLSRCITTNLRRFRCLLR